MGNASSVQAVHARIDNVIPHNTFQLARDFKQHAQLISHVAPLFPGGNHDRTQFVHSLRVLLSANGKLDLSDKRFKLVFSRAPEGFTTTDDNPDEQIYVSLVAIDNDGVIAAKVASEHAGRDSVEAFQSFRKTVEMHMHKVLESVPGPEAAAAASRHVPMTNRENNVSSSTLASTVLPDEPPTYQEANK